MAEIDMDANKSIKIIAAGNGRKYNFRPVVGADLEIEGVMPPKTDAADLADILLVDEATSEVTMGTIDSLALGQMVDLFGITAVDSCFDANEVFVEVVAP